MVIAKQPGKHLARRGQSPASKLSVHLTQRKLASGRSEASGQKTAGHQGVRDIVPLDDVVIHRAVRVLLQQQRRIGRFQTLDGDEAAPAQVLAAVVSQMRAPVA